MKKINMFQCEICNNVHFSENEASNCEDKGKETPLALVGDLVDYRVEMSGGYSDWFVELRVSKIEDRGHYLVYYFEEYDTDEDIWEESIHFNYVWGNDEFLELVKVK